MTVALLTPALRRAVSSCTGIVRALEECLPPPADARLFRMSCDVAVGEALIGAPLDHLGGVGASAETRAGAAVAAVGEALERYSVTYVPRERLVVATASELGSQAVEPECFALFSERQYASPGFSFRRFTLDTRVAWVEGWSLPDGAPCWIPAELVFLGPVEPREAPIGYATSSGAACAETRRESIVRGLYELLERDAFRLVWDWRLELPRLDWSDEPEFVERDRRFFAPSGLCYTAVDLSPVHGIPSVLGIVKAPPGFPGALGVGAGTAAAVGDAWLKALAEAFASRSAGAKLALVAPRRYGARGEGVVSFDDHIRFYADHAHGGAAAFLDRSSACTPVCSVRPIAGDPFDILCGCVAAAGSSAYAVDVTAPDVAELGLVVTKTVAPGLCSLDTVHDARFLGGRRLYDAPLRSGLRRGLDDEGADVNPFPHPFP